MEQPKLDLDKDEEKKMETLEERKARQEKKKSRFNKETKERIAKLMSSIELDSSNHKAYNLVALNYLLLKKYDIAHEYQTLAIRLAPNNPGYWTSLGELYSAQGRTIKALDAYKKSLQIDYKHIPALLNLGRLYAKQKKTDLAIVYHQEENYPQAILYYQESLLQKEASVTLFQLAECYTSTKNHKEAIRCYERAADLNPEYLFVWHNLGRSYYHTKQYYQAFECFKRIINLQSDNTNAWYQIAILFAISKKTPDVLKTLSTVLKLDPSFKEKITSEEVFSYLKLDKEFQALIS